MKRVLFRGARITLTWLGIAAFAISCWAADELVRIDFRNKIPGVLDAPVFGFDGVTGLDSSYEAELFAGNNPGSLAPVPGTIAPFLSGTSSGYLPYESTNEVLLSPAPEIGERIYFQLLIWKNLTYPLSGALRPAGVSDTYSTVVTNYLMPLVGLESFNLVPERLRITWHSDQLVVQWPYLAAQRYELQTTSRLEPPILWSTIFEWSDSGEAPPLFSVTNAVTTTAQFYRLERWEWP